MTTILFLMAYLMVGGVAFSRIQMHGKANCTKRYCCSDCGHGWLATFSIVLWPATLPVIAGGIIGAIPPKAQRDAAKEERRRQWELEEARHKTELARLALEEDRALERRMEELGIKA